MVEPLHVQVLLKKRKDVFLRIVRNRCRYTKKKNQTNLGLYFFYMNYTIRSLFLIISNYRISQYCLIKIIITVSLFLGTRFISVTTLSYRNKKKSNQLKFVFKKES